MFPTFVDYSFAILDCETRFENQEEERVKEGGGISDPAFTF